MRAQARAGERGVGQRRQRDRRVGHAQSLVARPGGDREASVAARRVAGNETVRAPGRDRPGRWRTSAVGGAAVVDPGTARVLGHQAVVHRQHGAARELGEAGRERSVALRTAGRECAAMNVERAPVGSAPGADPLAGHARATTGVNVASSRRSANMPSIARRSSSLRAAWPRAATAARRAATRSPRRFGARPGPVGALRSAGRTARSPPQVSSRDGPERAAADGDDDGRDVRKSWVRIGLRKAIRPLGPAQTGGLRRCSGAAGDRLQCYMLEITAYERAARRGAVPDRARPALPPRGVGRPCARARRAPAARDAARLDGRRRVIPVRRRRDAAAALGHRAGLAWLRPERAPDGGLLLVSDYLADLDALLDAAAGPGGGPARTQHGRQHRDDLCRRAPAARAPPGQPRGLRPARIAARAGAAALHTGSTSCARRRCATMRAWTWWPSACARPTRCSPARAVARGALGRQADDGQWEILADPAHRITNPVLYRKDEVLACWQRIAAPCCGWEGDRTDTEALVGRPLHQGRLPRPAARRAPGREAPARRRRDTCCTTTSRGAGAHPQSLPGLKWAQRCSQRPCAATARRVPQSRRAGTRRADLRPQAQQQLRRGQRVRRGLVAHRARDGEVFQPVVQRPRLASGATAAATGARSSQRFARRRRARPAGGAGSASSSNAEWKATTAHRHPAPRRPRAPAPDRAWRCADADAVDQDVCLVRGDLGLAQHDLEAVAERDPRRAALGRLGVEAQRDGGDREQAVAARVQAARLGRRAPPSAWRARGGAMPRMPRRRSRPSQWLHRASRDPRRVKRQGRRPLLALCGPVACSGKALHDRSEPRPAGALSSMSPPAAFQAASSSLHFGQGTRPRPDAAGTRRRTHAAAGQGLSVPLPRK